MTRSMLIDAVEPDETRVVITDEHGDVDHFDFVTKAKSQIKGNIFLGKITRVEPSLQAAFVEYGSEKQGFLPFSEIHPDYYQIPVEDRKRLLEEAEAEEREAQEKEAQAEEESEEDEKPKPRGRRRGRRKNFSKNSKAAAIEDDEQLVASEEAPQEEPSDKADDKEPQEEVTDAEATASDDEPEQEVSSNDADDAEEEVRKRRTPINRRYKIQEVIKPGQIILVQVIKEERGNKGVSLSSYMSLAGRYCVLMPNSPKDGGISRKIANNEDRKRLKQISAELKDSRGMSAIIRTAGIDRTRAEIKRDYEYLIKLWNQIREDALASIAPASVYEENDIIKRSIRDHYTGEIERIMVQGEASYKQAKAFMKMLMPSHAPRVKQHKESQPLFVAHNIEPTLNALYSSNAPLKSGGYLVINPTEALISIDVNSGRSTNERNVEETAYKTNLEAAHEVARQLRLRNLGGLVVVDFIDMNYGKHRRNVERAMRDALKGDRAKVQTSQISTFGLLELSRQRMGSSLEETTTKDCETCKGTGKTMLPEAIVTQLMRNLQSFAMDNEKASITVSVSAATMQALFNNYRTIVQTLEEQYNITIIIALSDKGDDSFYSFKASSGASFNSSETPSSKRSRSRNNRGGKNKNTNNRGNNKQRNQKQDKAASEDNENTDTEAAEDTANDSEKKPTRKRRNNNSRRRGKKPDTQDAENVSTEAEQKDDSADTTPSDTSPAETTDETEKPKRRRPTRRRNAKPDNVEEEAKPAAPVLKADIAPPPPAAEPAPAPTKPDTPAPKNKQKGWWQRVIDA